MSKVIKNFLYNTAYQILLVITPLLTSPYLSRKLGAEGNGIYGLGMAIVSYFTLFILLGLANYGNRTIATVKNDTQKLASTFCSIYAMQLLCAAIVIIGYCIYAQYIASNSAMAWILSINVLAAVVDINWFFFGMEEFQLTIIRNTCIKIGTIVCIFLFVKSVEDVWIYTLIMSLGSLISNLILWPFLKRYVSFVKVSLAEVLQHLKPNIILFLPVIAVSLYTRMDKIMLGILSESTQIGNMEVGYYEQAEKIVQIPLALITALGTVMLPHISNLVANGEKEKTKKYFQVSSIVITSLACVCCFGIMSINGIFIPWFLGKEFTKTASLLNILLPCQIFMAFASVIRMQYLIPYNKDKVYVVSVFLGAIANVSINLLLIPKWQSVGATIATLVAEIIVCSYQAMRVRKVLPIKHIIAYILPFAFFGMIMYTVVCMIPMIGASVIFNMLIRILVGAAVYIPLSAIYYYKKLKYVLKV